MSDSHWGWGWRGGLFRTFCLGSSFRNPTSSHTLMTPVPFLCSSSLFQGIILHPSHIFQSSQTLAISSRLCSKYSHDVTVGSCPLKAPPSMCKKRRLSPSAGMWSQHPPAPTPALGQIPSAPSPPHPQALQHSLLLQVTPSGNLWVLQGFLL